MNSFKAFCFVTIPLCLAGCVVLFAVEKLFEIEVGVLPPCILGFLSDMVTPPLCSKLNWFQD